MNSEAQKTVDEIKSELTLELTKKGQLSGSLLKFKFLCFHDPELLTVENVREDNHLLHIDLRNPIIGDAGRFFDSLEKLESVLIRKRASTIHVYASESHKKKEFTLMKQSLERPRR